MLEKSYSATTQLLVGLGEYRGSVKINKKSLRIKDSNLTVFNVEAANIALEMEVFNISAATDGIVCWS